MDIVLMTFGALLVASLLIERLGRWSRLPRITLLVLLGIIIGPHSLDLMPIDVHSWYATIANLTLTMVAFLLGSTLSLPKLRAHGASILIVSVSVMAISALTVGAGLLLMGVSLSLALLLAGIGLATAPAAVHDVVQESRASGPFTAVLLGVVAVDDAWALILFSVLLGIVSGIDGGSLFQAIGDGAWDVFGAIGLGVAIGLPAAFLTGRVRPGEPVLAEALGVVLLISGAALWLEVSFLLAGMTAGSIVVNLARHHNRPFREIEHIEWPFMVLFFILAGATVDVMILGDVGLIGAAFVGLRLLGRIAGGWLGARLSGMPAAHAQFIGVALTPQAGVALGMALVASGALPDSADEIIALTIGTTVAFELAGPFLTQFALRRVGEAGKAMAVNE